MKLYGLFDSRFDQNSNRYSRFDSYSIRTQTADSQVPNEWCCKMQKMGVVRGHSRSSAMSPFDRAHMTSYSTLIETMRLSFTVFEIYDTIRDAILTLQIPNQHPCELLMLNDYTCSKSVQSVSFVHPNGVQQAQRCVSISPFINIHFTANLSSHISITLLLGNTNVKI